MTISILLPFLVCVAGLLVWAIASKSEKPNVYVTESGRIAYACGLLVTLFACASHQVTALSPAMSASIAFITCVAGMLVWVLASHAILKEAGKIAFACGLLVSLFEVATHVVRF